MAESVNQRRHRKNVSGFFLHRDAQRGNRLRKASLLQQRQTKAKIQLVPPRLEFDGFLDLVGCISKSPRVVIGISNFLDRNDRKGIERLSMEMHRNGFLTAPR